MKWEHAKLDGARVWWRSRGEAAENVVVGHMTKPLAEYLQKRFDALIAAHGGTVAFQDWFDAPTYDPEFRSSWQRWLARQRRIRAVHCLTNSRLVRMGLAVANLAYPSVGFLTYTRRADYVPERNRHLPLARGPRV